MFGKNKKKSDVPTEKADEIAVSKGKKAGKKGDLSKAKNWYADRYESILVQRNILFILMLLSLVALIIAVLAVATLNSSKIFEPYVIAVDEKSGAVTHVPSKSVKTFSALDSTIRYFVAKYVRARLSYDVDLYEYNYNKVVRLLSTKKEFNKFGQWLRGDADSPLSYGHNIRRNIVIKSIDVGGAYGPQTAHVRVKLTDVDARGAQRNELHYAITLKYAFFTLDLTESQRYINPLGFQITSWQMVPDAG